MSVFDFGNKTKAYKRGVSDDAAINAKKEQQLKQENDKVIARQNQSNRDIENGVNNLQDMAEFVENERVYGEDDTVHFMELGDQERAYIVGTVNTLAQKQTILSQNQKDYFTNLKAYLSVTDTYQAPLEGIAKIEDVDVSMAILKVVYEFNYLANDTWDFEENEDFQDYLDEFRLSRRDIRTTKAKIVENLKFGTNALIEQYHVYSDDSGKFDDASDEVSQNEQMKQPKDNHEEDAQSSEEGTEEDASTSFSRVIQTYSYPEAAFKDIGNGVDLVQTTRDLLLDRLEDVLDKITPMIQTDKQRDALGEYINNYEYYLGVNEKLAKEKKEAKLAAGKKSVGDLGIKSIMLVTLPLIISPVILKSMKGDKKAQQAYSEDLMRLQRMTLGHVAALHEGVAKIDVNHPGEIDQLLVEIKKSLDALGISYDELPSVDFRTTDTADMSARERTRSYIQDHILEIREAKTSWEIRVYDNERNGSQSGYFTKRESEGAFSKIMEYQGSPDEMVGIIDTTLSNNGKSGVLFLDDQLVVKVILSHPVRIKYADMDDVIGNKVVAHTKDGKAYQYAVDYVDEVAFKHLLEHVMTFWQNQ